MWSRREGGAVLFVLDGYGGIDTHGARGGEPYAAHNHQGEHQVGKGGAGYEAQGFEIVDPEARGVEFQMGQQPVESEGGYGGNRKQNKPFGNEAPEDGARGGSVYLSDGDFADALLGAEPEGAEQPRKMLTSTNTISAMWLRISVLFWTRW